MNICMLNSPTIISVTQLGGPNGRWRFKSASPRFRSSASPLFGATPRVEPNLTNKKQTNKEQYFMQCRHFTQDVPQYPISAHFQCHLRLPLPFLFPSTVTTSIVLLKQNSYSCWLQSFSIFL